MDITALKKIISELENDMKLMQEKYSKELNDVKAVIKEAEAKKEAEGKTSLEKNKEDENLEKGKAKVDEKNVIPEVLKNNSMPATSSNVNVSAMDSSMINNTSPYFTINNNSLINLNRIAKFNRNKMTASTFIHEYENMQKIRNIDFNSERMPLELVEYLNVYEEKWFDEVVQPMIGRTWMDIKNAFFLQFSTSLIADPLLELKEIKMKDSLEEYNESFKQIMWKYCISNTSKSVRDIYLEGLIPAIRNRVTEFCVFTQVNLNVEAFMDNVKTVYGGKTFKSEILECNFCHKIGHIKKNCFRNPYSANYKPIQGVTCNRCKEKGHYANKCPTLNGDKKR